LRRPASNNNPICKAPKGRYTDGPYKRPVCTGRLHGCVRALCPHALCTRPVQPCNAYFCTTRLYGSYRRVVWTDQPYKRAVHPTVFHYSVYLFIVKVTILLIKKISGEGILPPPYTLPLSASTAPRRPQPSQSKNLKGGSETHPIYHCVQLNAILLSSA